MHCSKAADIEQLFPLGIINEMRESLLVTKVKSAISSSSHILNYVIDAFSNSYYLHSEFASASVAFYKECSHEINFSPLRIWKITHYNTDRLIYLSYTQSR